jgi:hypothetical protein
MLLFGLKNVAHYFPRIQKVVLQIEIDLEIVKMFYVVEIEYVKR